MKIETKSEYEVAAEKFLSDHGITFKAIFIYHGIHFEGDTDSRDIYAVTLTREGRKPFSTMFGQSQAHSSHYFYDYKKRLKYSYSPGSRFNLEGLKYVKPIAPNAHDLLACLTKSYPGSFETFCSEYGYDTDSSKAEKIYHTSQAEWEKVFSFFSPEEIEKLQEIN